MSRSWAAQPWSEGLSSASSVSADTMLSTDSNLYRLSCIGLLALAAVLRLYELPAEILSHDEAVVVEISKGAVQEVVNDTRWKNSSPILYPLLLGVAQTVDSSPLTVRLLSAIASILTVAALLLWLPRVGIAPGAALLAGLMATLSPELIRHAQDAREYSFDALVATFMLIGLLKYLRGGGRALLCATLAIAPLVQYGLVLFGVAVLATLALSPRAHLGDGAAACRSDWRERMGCLADAGSWFTVSAGITYGLTLHAQGLNAVASGRFGPILQDQVYRGDLGDLGAVIGFAATEHLAFAGHFAPMVVVAAGGIALAALVVRSIATQRALSPVFMLFLLAGATALSAALLSLYPLGPHRQCMYLAPVFFVGLAHALYTVLRRLPARPRQALTVMVAVAAPIEGATMVAADFPYQERGQAETVLAALDQHLGKDPIYLPYISIPIMDYYYPGQRDQFFRGSSCRWRETAQCQQDFVMELINMHLMGAARVWVVFFNYRTWSIVRQWRDEGLAQHVVGTGFSNLFLIPNIRSVVAPQLTQVEALIQVASNLAPQDIAGFHVHVDAAANALTYMKRPCAAADADEPIWLELTPRDVNALPPRRQRHGWDNLGFDFAAKGVRRDDVCVAALPLPDYEIQRIDTGQANWRKTLHLGQEAT